MGKRSVTVCREPALAGRTWRRKTVEMARLPGVASGDASTPVPHGVAERVLRWRKATASASSGCVEVAGSGGAVLVRDSKDSPDRPVMVLTRAAFAGLVADLREGAG